MHTEYHYGSSTLASPFPATIVASVQEALDTRHETRIAGAVCNT